MEFFSPKSFIVLCIAIAAQLAALLKRTSIGSWLVSSEARQLLAYLQFKKTAKRPWKSPAFLHKRPSCFHAFPTIRILRPKLRTIDETS